MRKKIVIMILAVAALFILTLNRAVAFRAGDITDLKITGYHYTTLVRGTILDKDETTYKIFTKNQNTHRYIILYLSGMSTLDPAPLWVNDFVLRYKFRSLEVRNRCSAVAPINSEGKPGNFIISPSNRTAFAFAFGKNISFALAFFIGNDLDEFNLDRVGTKESIEYRLPDGRPFSVSVITDKMSSNRFDTLNKLLKDGGYFVNISQDTENKNEDIEIQYAELARGAAQEISTRLMITFGVKPKLKEIVDMTSFDIIIKIGHNVFKDV